MRPTIEEIKEGFAKCGLKPVQGETLDTVAGTCCGLAAYAAYLGLPLAENVLCLISDRVGKTFRDGFIYGWDGRECIHTSEVEGYELGRKAWEACKCDG